VPDRVAVALTLQREQVHAVRHQAWRSKALDARRVEAIRQDHLGMRRRRRRAVVLSLR
jgi:hypothetical protein